MKKLKDEWYFLRQDLVSYSISTFFYLALCLIREFSFNSVIYALFDCFMFYIPFWYIRINFNATYHSDSWKHCKMWTRIMLCVGVFVLWILPVKYSLFNGLFVAFGCCLVLYLVALEVAEKKLIKQENEELQSQLDITITKLEKFEKVDLYKMSENDLRSFGANFGLSEVQLDILVLRIVNHLKISEICKYCNYGRTTIKYHISKIKEKLNIDKI